MTPLMISETECAKQPDGPHDLLACHGVTVSLCADFDTVLRYPQVDQRRDRGPHPWQI